MTARVRHFGPELLEALAESDPPNGRRVFLEFVDHVAAGCGICSAGALTVREGLERREGEGSGYGGLVRRAMRAVRRLTRDLGVTPATPGARLSAFLDLSGALRWRAAGDDPELRTPQLVADLLDYGRTVAAADGESAEDLARQAVVIAQSLRPPAVPAGLVRDLLAEAWALVGRELLGEEAAGTVDFTLEHAEDLLQQGTGDPVAKIRVCGVRMLWHWRWEGAERALLDLPGLLRLAVECGSRTDQGELMLWQSLLYRELGQASTAHSVYAEALLLLGEEEGKILLKQLLALQARLRLFPHAPPQA